MRRAAFVPLLLATGCAAPAWRTAPHDVPYQRVPQPRLHEPPRVAEVVEGWSTLEESTVRPLAETVNPGYWVERELLGVPALDVNTFGQVPDSPWFENRLGPSDLDPATIARGPNQSQGPAPGPLVVLGGKLEGATPGLVVEDGRGDRYVVKFDPPAFPNLASGAELIATKVLWAAGYHVPENYVVRFDLNRLALSPQAETAGKYGRRIPLTRERLVDLIALVNPYPDGTIRALFSKIIPGRALGPFSYGGLRADDPNDVIPHQRRRSLRGLWLFSAWLNNVDTRDANSYDAFIADPAQPERGYVKHYLLDFGDALGSAGVGPKYLGEGYEGLIDWPQIFKSLITAGLWYRYWLPLQRSPYGEVGVFEAQVFDPERWRPTLPNPAFDQAELLDTYWAASIIARFDVDDLMAVVKEARYRRPGASAWMLRVLLQRQYTLLSWIFGRVLPLDRPTLEGGHRLTLEDLAVRAALLAPEQVGYDYRVVWHGPDGDVDLRAGQIDSPSLDLTEVVERLRAEAGARLSAAPFISVTWRRPLPTPEIPSMQVHLRILSDGLLLVGLDREVD
ncbi:MAG: hypothetical protein KC933_00175 [Myxococcales bacterium]|nr:hypothetical protein [Myxococcales bacterium]